MELVGHLPSITSPVYCLIFFSKSASYNRQHAPVVELLLNFGAHANAQSSRKETALHQAASGGHRAAVELSLKSGANVYAATYLKEVGLHRRHLEMWWSCC